MDEELLRIIDLFDNEEVTTADKIDRPAAASYREMFDDFNKRNPFNTGGLSVREKNLIKKKFPEADFTKGKFGFKKGDPKYEAARYAGKRFKDRKERTLRESKDPALREQKRLKAKAYYSREKENILERARKKYEVSDEFRKQVATQNKKNQLKIVNERGLFPPGQKPQDNVWHDLYRSSQAKGGGNRFILDKKFIDNVPKKDDGTPRWAKDNYYKKIKFKDTKTGKTITYNGMKKYLDDTFGKGTYDKALNGYKAKTDLRDTRIKVRGKEQKLGTVLRDAVRAQGNVNVNSALEVHHPFGIKENWWDNQVVFRDANRKLNLINNRLTRAAVNIKDDAARKNLFNKFGKEVDKLPGGISLFFEGQQVGTKTPTSESVIRGAAKTIRDPAITRAVNQLSLSANPFFSPGVLGEAFKTIPTPLGAVGLTAGFGVDPTSAIDRASVAAEAAFAPALVKQSAKMGAAQRLFNLGLPAKTAMRLARIASPIGIASLGAEGLYQAGKFTKRRLNELRAMSPEQRQELRRKGDEFAFSEFAAAGGGIAKEAGDPSGAMLESMNPDSQGLSGLLKRVKKG